MKSLKIKKFPGIQWPGLSTVTTGTWALLGGTKISQALQNALSPPPKRYTDMCFKTLFLIKDTKRITAITGGVCIISWRQKGKYKHMYLLKVEFFFLQSGVLNSTKHLLTVSYVPKTRIVTRDVTVNSPYTQF